MTGWKDIINRERGPTPVRSSLRALAAARGSRRHQSLANGAPPPFARSAPRSAAGASRTSLTRERGPTPGLLVDLAGPHPHSRARRAAPRRAPRGLSIHVAHDDVGRADDGDEIGDERSEERRV